MHDSAPVQFQLVIAQYGKDVFKSSHVGYLLGSGLYSFLDVVRHTPWVMEKYGQTGEAAKFLEFLKRELIPTVENKYRIDPDRRVLSGQSLGGSFGLWVAFTEPSLFGSYVLTSPSIWWAKHALFDVEANYASNHKDLKAKIFLAVGQMERPGECQTCTADMAGDVATIAQRLRSRKYPSLQLKSEVSAGTYHETTFPIGLTKGLQWLFLGPGD